MEQWPRANWLIRPAASQASIIHIQNQRCNTRSSTFPKTKPTEPLPIAFSEPPSKDELINEPCSMLMLRRGWRETWRNSSLSRIGWSWSLLDKPSCWAPIPICLDTHHVCYHSSAVCLVRHALHNLMYSMLVTLPWASFFSHKNILGLVEMCLQG